jgi:hypothetical protein
MADRAALWNDDGMRNRDGDLLARPQASPARDFAVCRVEAAGVNRDLLFCLMDHPGDCPHALSFGFSYICCRPQPPAGVDARSLPFAPFPLKKVLAE